ncbi:hypothetical protein GCM10009080_55350 [Cupriavidus pauculus]
MNGTQDVPSNGAPLPDLDNWGRPKAPSKGKLTSIHIQADSLGVNVSSLEASDVLAQ